MSTPREHILGELREALATPTNPHVGDAATRVAAADITALPDADAMRSWMPPVPKDDAGRRALFAELSEKLQTRFVVLPDLAAAQAHLKTIAAEEGWTHLGIHANPQVEAIAAELDVTPVLFTAEADRAELDRCQAGLTTCTALIAQTGSVLVTANDGGRALSCLPEHHLVIATADQLLPDLPAAYALLQKSPTTPAFASLITGPSRTADIERILVLGAHGPKRLTILLLEDTPPEAV